MGIQVTRRDLFAIRIVEAIAAADGPVGSEALIKLLGIKKEYVSQTTHPLVKAGVLVGIKGPGGGFELARPAEEITGADILAAIPRGIMPDDREDDDAMKQCRAHLRELVVDALKKIRFKSKGRKSK